ncbi:HAD-like protein [Corynespora cassiicola Philippines]|uniref:Mitochondrial import inner membrane translocase subunit TIM50 n=1 Tax=Corynespora cassiicola Philippines TaxID=1448308 RepID=A0A2T2NRT3_CORCC|nr:HAD-like protein [Corynespora cassiicola Philippines]
MFYSEAEAAVSEAPSPQRVSPRKKQPKIMLPAPLPTQEYCELARAEPSVSDSGERMLVILDLNGTLLYRPNPRRKPSEHKPRPFLGEFMEYLFRNFHVMVWSSSRPENVAKMVEKNLDGAQKARLIACWGREQFGLSAKHYDQNVQCYKNLQRVWSNEDIQKKHSDYQDGKRFDQRNTILIDDSALKANAQPHNLILIPEFTATDEQINGADILKEVAGYLEKVKVQSDVSSYMHKNPFKAGEHTYEWPG